MASVHGNLFHIPALNKGKVLVKTYSDLLRRTTIDVFYDVHKGLSASVQTSALSQRVTRSYTLPLQGVPKQVQESKDVSKLKLFFEEVHLIPEKGVDQVYNRVAVHVSGKGGGRFKIPFQPGLALGSIVSGNTLIKMEAYAKSVAASEALEEQITAAEQKIEVLEQKIKSKQESSKGKAAEALIALWTKEVEKTKEFIEKLAEKISGAQFGEIPIFEGFHQGIESPIDMTKSKMEVQARGFDSLQYSSQYIDMKESISEIHDKVKHASSANQVSISGGAWMVKGKVSHEWSEATSDRLAQIKKEGAAKGVLMINALVTTRHVRSFGDLHYDKAKLKMLLQAMKTQDQSTLERYGITLTGDRKEICLLTEAVLGGSFTALVIFMDEEKMARKLEKEAEEHSKTTSASLSGKFSFVKGSIGFSHTDHGGTQSEDDVLNSLSNTKISIEINSQGGIPIFTRDVLEHEILKHLDLNPAKFELSPQDEAEAENFAKASSKEKMIAVYKRQMKMENAQVAVMNTYRGLTSTKTKQNVHTPQSVMEAYDNFATKIVSDPDCGIPIGFNYQVLTEAQLKEILSDLEGGKQELNTASKVELTSTEKKV